MRLFVYASQKAAKAKAVLEVDKITKNRATIAGSPKLDSIKPGMVCYPGEGRKPDRSTMHTILEVQPKALIFKDVAVEPSTPPAEEKVHGQ